MNFSRLHISVFLAIAVFIWVTILLIQGTPVSLKHLAPFGTVVGALFILALSFEHFLWRQQWLHGWFVKRPDLRGTWQVTLESDWINPETNQRIPPITGYYGVEQSLSKLQMHLMTSESESWLIAHSIISSQSENGYRISGVYSNNPDIHLRGARSEIHFGSLLLDTHGQNKCKPDTMTGEYWTSRKTKGKMTLRRISEVVTTRFHDAMRFQDQHD